MAARSRTLRPRLAGGRRRSPLLAYVPALASSPGRMPADTKLYLYLDPGRLIGDAPWTFDARQFAGWVPHQVIAYLWPQGPWYWLGDDGRAARLGRPPAVDRHAVPRRRRRRAVAAPAASGSASAAALAAALVYQLAPYILPYVSRTSAMLLPWAGLGWIVGLTVARRDPQPRGATPRSCALVVATVGAVNATALAMIVPAPVLWLVVAGRRATRSPGAGRPPRRRAIGGLSLGVSLWWIAMVVDPGPPRRRRAGLLRVAGVGQLHVDVDRGVARPRLLADLRPRRVRRDDDGRPRLHGVRPR